MFRKVVISFLSCIFQHCVFVIIIGFLLYFDARKMKYFMTKRTEITLLVFFMFGVNNANRDKRCISWFFGEKSYRFEA